MRQEDPIRVGKHILTRDVIFLGDNRRPLLAIIKNTKIRITPKYGNIAVKLLILILDSFSFIINSPH